MFGITVAKQGNASFAAEKSTFSLSKERAHRFSRTVVRVGMGYQYIFCFAGAEIKLLHIVYNHRTRINKEI